VVLFKIHVLYVSNTRNCYIHVWYVYITLSKTKAKKQDEDRLNLSLYGKKARRFQKLAAFKENSYANVVNELTKNELQKLGLEDVET